MTRIRTNLNFLFFCYIYKQIFSKTDFENEEIQTMLRTIVLHKMNKNVLLTFHSMNEKDKKEMNHLMNMYIQELTEDNWLDKIQDEYTTILNKEIFTDEFKAQDYEPEIINTDIEFIYHIAK